MEPARPSVIDLALVAVLTAASVAEALLTEQYDERVELPIAAVFALPLLLRRHHPLWSLAGVLAVFVTQRLVFGEIWDTGSSLAIPLVAVFAVAAHTDLLRAVGGLLATIVTLSVADMGPDGSDYAFISLIMGAIWSAGLAYHRQLSLVATVQDQARQLEAAALEREQLADAAERSRIARELHDVVAHAVSTIVVQAEAGQALQARAPDRATAAFEAIQASGRQALDELRRMLGVLRDVPHAAADLAPQPGLDDLPQLVAAVRATGLDVTLAMEGATAHPELSPGVELTAYRVVQEALTNTLKHADAGHATVRLAHADGRLLIEVTDDGHGMRDGSPDGHGLAGMRERVQLHGGRFDVASGQHGVTVRAELGTP